MYSTSRFLGGCAVVGFSFVFACSSEGGASDAGSGGTGTSSGGATSGGAPAQGVGGSGVPGSGGLGGGASGGSGGTLPEPSSGCGKPPGVSGQEYVELETRASELRKFYLSVPSNYDPEHAYPVVFGIHGRDYNGKDMRDYLDLESQMPNDWAIFVYPDALPRTFGPDSAVGWENGPIPSQYSGTRDVDFFRDIVDHMNENYCVDEGRFFATGQSWGGDFTNIAGCILGDIFDAIAPVAANGDYYLPTPSTEPSACAGGPKAFWGMHSKADEYLPLDPLGYQYRDYFLELNGCDAESGELLDIADALSDDECWSYSGCSVPTRWCSYNASSGHQIPRSYYPREVVDFFKSL